MVNERILFYNSLSVFRAICSCVCVCEECAAVCALALRDSGHCTHSRIILCNIVLDWAASSWQNMRIRGWGERQKAFSARSIYVRVTVAAWIVCAENRAHELNIRITNTERRNMGNIAYANVFVNR